MHVVNDAEATLPSPRPPSSLKAAEDRACTYIRVPHEQPTYYGQRPRCILLTRSTRARKLSIPLLPIERQNSQSRDARHVLHYHKEDIQRSQITPS